MATVNERPTAAAACKWWSLAISAAPSDAIHALSLASQANMDVDVVA